MLGTHRRPQAYKLIVNNCMTGANAWKVVTSASWLIAGTKPVIPKIAAIKRGGAKHTSGPPTKANGLGSVKRQLENGHQAQSPAAGTTPSVLNAEIAAAIAARRAQLSAGRTIP